MTTGNVKLMAASASVPSWLRTTMVPVLASARPVGGTTAASSSKRAYSLLVGGAHHRPR